MQIELVKKCCKCSLMLELNQFNKNKCSKDGLQGMCKKCDKEYRNKNKKKAKKYQNYQKEYRKVNKEKFIKYLKYLYNSSDISKNRIYVSIVLRPKILIRDNNRCVLCKSSNLIIHHIVPIKIDKNKIKDVENLVTLCRYCHQYIINIKHKI